MTLIAIITLLATVGVSVYVKVSRTRNKFYRDYLKKRAMHKGG